MRAAEAGSRPGSPPGAIGAPGDGGRARRIAPRGSPQAAGTVTPAVATLSERCGRPRGCGGIAAAPEPSLPRSGLQAQRHGPCPAAAHLDVLAGRSDNGRDGRPPTRARRDLAPRIATRLRWTPERGCARDVPAHRSARRLPDRRCAERGLRATIRAAERQTSAGRAQRRGHETGRVLGARRSQMPPSTFRLRPYSARRGHPRNFWRDC
jgi:hypothetical protein